VKSAKLLIFHHSDAATQSGAPSISACQIVAPAKENPWEKWWENHGEKWGGHHGDYHGIILGISKNWIKTHKKPRLDMRKLRNSKLGLIVKLWDFIGGSPFFSSRQWIDVIISTIKQRGGSCRFSVDPFRESQSNPKNMKRCRNQPKSPYDVHLFWKIYKSLLVGRCAAELRQKLFTS